jgi:hypothetical protein
MATITNDNPIAEKTIKAGINQKLVRNDSQRLSSLVFMICVSNLSKVARLFPVLLKHDVVCFLCLYNCKGTDPVFFHL